VCVCVCVCLGVCVCSAMQGWQFLSFSFVCSPVRDYVLSLSGAYMPHIFWWEMFDLLRRLLVVAVVVFVQKERILYVPLWCYLLVPT